MCDLNAPRYGHSNFIVNKKVFAVFGMKNENVYHDTLEHSTIVRAN